MTVTSIFSSVQPTELQYENRRCIKMSGGEILSAGSAQPPLEPGKVRLYGFEYSPYVQRVHMVLIAKNIPHDVKNIDLKNKPDWFLKLNPAGKVPVLDTGDKVLAESLEIVVFLDKNYPGTSLRNTDPEKSAKDREIVEKFEGLRNEFHEAIKNKDYQSPVTIASLSLFRSELEKRGTTFLAGSAQPPLEPGKVRLYGFEYSPYVQRVHMVLIAKNIPHDVKNIDLKNKPDWFLKLNPAGKVPVLDTGDKVLTESLDIVVFLDKNYPGTSLRNTDPERSAKNREIVEKFEGYAKEFRQSFIDKDYKPSEGTRAFFSLFQSELEKRGTTFLGGDSPGLIDYVIWPWFERLKVARELHGKGDIEIPEDKKTKAAKIGNWKRGMEQQKAVKETMHTLEEHVKPNTSHFSTSLHTANHIGQHDPNKLCYNINSTPNLLGMLANMLVLGSTEPPKEEGKSRLYSMNFCPFAQRARIICNVKKIPHDIVNIDLKNKPDWYFKIHPKGLVPALDLEGQILVESLDIAEFLNEKYPDPPLYPADPEKKAKDKELIEKFGKVVATWAAALYKKDGKTNQERIQSINDVLLEMETELEERGTTFYGGSTEPPKEEGKSRLYSMNFCPFAQRARIICNVKKIPHDIVNIDLKNKPDWYFKIHPKGLVPALDLEGQILVESLDIAEFLNEKYPDPPLYPADPEKKAKDKELIEKFSKLTAAWSVALHSKDDKSSQESAITDALLKMEIELVKRGTTFYGGIEGICATEAIVERGDVTCVQTGLNPILSKQSSVECQADRSRKETSVRPSYSSNAGPVQWGGDSPGMVDYMFWPWVERSRVPSLTTGEDFDFSKDKLPKLVVWKNEMKERKEIKDTITDPQIQATFYKGYLQGKPNYDL
uniref:Uncharacterized protein n=1 Tax=Timema douglasi TaxID=61478 RepID=A0A7R8Z6G3_TIMDO|nr:unnamed protein product [Timema douglasi]